MSFIMFKYPTLPTAPPTSNLPFEFNGISTKGFCTYPFSFGDLLATTTIPPSEPFPFICMVNLSSSFFILLAIILAIVNVLPSAATATGLKSCVILAFSTKCVVFAHIILTLPSYAKNFIILSLLSILYLL